MKKILNNNLSFSDLRFRISNLSRLPADRQAGISDFACPPTCPSAERRREPRRKRGFRAYQRAFSLVEAVIGIALIAISLIALTGAYSFYLKVGLKNTDTLQSAFLLQEGIEAVTLLRDDAWSNLSTLPVGSPRYLSWNGSKWVATTTPITIDGTFVRTVRLDDVYRRNSDKDIVASTSPDAKTIDVNTKQLTVRVTASSTPVLDRQMVTYLTNLFE